MDKSILIEYADMREEIRDIRRRINELEHGIKNLGEVTDSVTGTRKDGTFGSIRISGYPTPLYYKKKAAIDNLHTKLDCMELELLELTCKAEEYIESIPRSELRMMFRFYFLDNLSYPKVAERMNGAYLERQIKYTDENVKKRIQRFFKNVPLCPDRRC